MQRSKSGSVVALILAFGLIAAACDSTGGAADSTTATTQPTATTSSSPPQELDTVTVQLDWVPNTNHTGIYVADENGYYAEEGIEISILPYSGGNGDSLVAEGAADFAISFQNSITLSRPAGLPIVAVAAILQHTAEAIGVNESSDDINRPADLDGKLYAGFGGPFEEPLMKAVIQADGGAGEFESVILDTAAYEAVYNGSADFVIPFITWEGIEAEINEEPMKYFRYSDYGLPDQYSVIIVASEDYLAGNADLAARFLRATQKGFEFGATSPDEAAQILIDANPGVFNLPELVFRSQNLLAEEYYLDESGQWGSIDLDRFSDYSAFLYEAGIVADENGAPLTTEPNWADFVYQDWTG